MEKVKVTTLEELTPLIGKKVIVDGKQIGLFLTESGEIHAINNICPHKQGPLSEAYSQRRVCVLSTSRSKD